MHLSKRKQKEMIFFCSVKQTNIELTFPAMKLQKILNIGIPFSCIFLIMMNMRMCVQNLTLLCFYPSLLKSKKIDLKALILQLVKKSKRSRPIAF